MGGAASGARRCPFRVRNTFSVFLQLRTSPLWRDHGGRPLARDAAGAFVLLAIMHRCAIWSVFQKSLELPGALAIRHVVCSNEKRRIWNMICSAGICGAFVICVGCCGAFVIYDVRFFVIVVLLCRLK